MIGAKFSKLTVMSPAGTRPNGARRVRAWACKCECGKERIVAETELKRGRVTSCKKGHGQIKSSEYRSHYSMKERCLNPKNKEYHNYGGRGISICARWIDGEKCNSGFQCFLEDMGRKPNKAFSLDRIDPNGNYEPKNCRWATAETQAQNRRNTRMVLYNGQSVPLAQAARAAGVKYGVALERIDRYGVSGDLVLHPGKLVKRKRGTAFLRGRIVTAPRER